MQDGGVHAVQEEPLPMAEEPIPWEEVQLYADRPKSLTRLASDLPPLLKEEFVQCLIRNRDVFAWSTEELPGVKPEVAKHKLHLLPDSRPVKKKQRNFSADQNKIIRVEVDQLRKMVDSTAGYERICMLDAYQGNAGATYQRMMDKIFREQIRRNVEVYVDDILIKSPLAVNLIKDVEETCKTLRQYGLKLNPLKCLFGAKGGKFLGYLVTEQGIEANPEKVRSWHDMQVPQNLKETQKLVGRITALSRFISKSADQAAPFFKPVAGEPLWVYLSATPKAVGAVLIKEHDNVQWSVYFFNHLLKGVESRYTALEKLVYGLVLITRRLRPYFLSHPIIVLTNITMGRALTNVEVAGWLIKRATELGEYDIQYQPCTAIKAQALADFLTKIHQTSSEETWKVYVDGSTTHQRSGVGILLISPQGDILQLAVRLNFRATNNEAEYEALLAGMQAARHVGAARVIIYSDSQLVTQQVADNFMINCDKLQVYREAYEKMKEEFSKVTVTKIPRAENEKADKLAKMASSLTTWVLDRSTTQTFLIAQIDLQNNREATIDWRVPMISYLKQSILPADLEESRLVRKQAHAYVMIGDQPYKRSFSGPLLKCLGMEEADQALREIHLGCCVSQAVGH
ncbi:uncharacterized protein LOC121999660 [Zingiber officinale]|uniref:uncharacterized protein LOC121999660 n=1 Tax=Zingiber officinale TaxID=94328 RepID=UPI001C4AEBBA|nr:uncharacterized protein LOC121999660 [Zingiber officinale]